tara:strand:- start:17 stop:187 length:171 start_codon:yes stop_codon:yes gene_type:complete
MKVATMVTVAVSIQETIDSSTIEFNYSSFPGKRIGGDVEAQTNDLKAPRSKLDQQV